MTDLGRLFDLPKGVGDGRGVLELAQTDNDVDGREYGRAVGATVDERGPDRSGRQIDCRHALKAGSVNTFGELADADDDWRTRIDGHVSALPPHPMLRKTRRQKSSNPRGLDTTPDRPHRTERLPNSLTVVPTVSHYNKTPTSRR